MFLQSLKYNMFQPKLRPDKTQVNLQTTQSNQSFLWHFVIGRIDMVLPNIQNVQTDGVDWKDCVDAQTGCYSDALR